MNEKNMEVTYLDHTSMKNIFVNRNTKYQWQFRKYKKDVLIG